MTETIFPHEMPSVLNRAPSATILSLDCFDTLLWRDCHLPTDLFNTLSGMNAGQRAVGEANARRAEATLRGRNEVMLGQIYSHVLPDADDATRALAIEHELSAEARTCYAFAPTVDLMRRARADGLKVIIVSDTYLDERQLRELIRASAGEEIAELIDKVFVSSSAGVSKGQGLLAKVIQTLKCNPTDILHIGDNRSADYDGARALGIPALHLAQFGELAQQRLRLERACQQIFSASSDDVMGLQPHRAIIAAGDPVIEDPAVTLGFGVLGPVFHGFEQWLQEEAAALKDQRGGAVHWLFMLRDGHLPFAVNQIAGAQANASCVEISRFTATAASLTSNEAIDRHVALEHGLNPSTLARQMLFTEEEIEQFCSAEDPAEASQILLRELRSGRRKKVIRRRAREFADRLAAHVRSVVDPQPGDTLMLVDLGYNGSAQNRVDGWLQDQFNVHVAGRYLLLREMAATELDKRGLIDDRHFDPELLEAMCSNVAVLEQLATTTMGSTVDYAVSGEPIRRASSVKGRQSAVRDKVQKGCLEFCEQARAAPVVRLADAARQRAWRDCATSVLLRFMYLPQSAELDVVKNFEHDVNLGSDRMVSLFDPDHAREGMRRRGLFYMKGASRMFLPAELAGEDIGTRLSLLVQKRFGLGLTYADYAPRSLELPAIYVGAQDSARATISATPTHEGYFVARIPVNDRGQAVALQFGGAVSWLEIAGITRAPVRSLQGGEVNDAAPQQLTGQFDEMQEHGPGIFECTSETGLVLLHLPEEASDEPEMIEVVFRPLAMRESETARQEAAPDETLERCTQAA
ncbi:MAG: HAD family hydrolase [Erythrobacter sp.]